MNICICIGHILPTMECCSVKGVYVCPLGTGLENVNSTVSGVVNVGGDYHILDIYCQQLWNVVQLGGVCVPFEHRVGE